MKPIFARLAAWLSRPDVRRAIDLAVLAAGADAGRRLLVDIHERLSKLERRGMVPRDDLATLGDLAKLEGRLAAAGALVDLDDREAGRPGD